ncbi:MAG: 50S ribosomal protein L6 [Deltaproteobacteria bacterium]|nr:50S ribosomal protein L6 [Deltaproteobacteria bacterium]
MSRVGKQPISVPSAAKVSLKGDTFEVKGPKGQITQKVLEGVEVKFEDGTMTVSRTSESISARAIHGLMRSLLANAIQGVTEGFKKQLEIIGVGYRAEVQGRQINFALGYSHPIHFPIPTGIDIEIDKQNRITVAGCDRQQVGQVAAEIRSLRKPDPYKGKGIRYTGEVIRRKVGKAGGK